ncbi:lasso peptide biosynthesis B2 protein [Romboutsia lituseburensis]|uniref:Transglutaminase-like superfamily protein n=1 Tax=Romboutsia lituseburensis DSM 797 TaxID=1121325 RepID=A0A1G9PP67_9FIRM|nr:lasso peptide biosynthesis B2 protein [Romboutsia lituseburensis]CEH33469.1 Transglutaminase-like superfamily [Romboutsia lituseburensis]SDM00616.1 Transglutaminase-like superfamily protein [Romboutsia lituseburensis DSM 797]
MLSFYQWVKRINKFLFKLSIKEKLLFIEAFFLTGLMRAKILKVPFNKLKKELGTYNTESADDVVLDDYKIAKIVRDVVVTISKFTPWESLCLVQAMTVQRMLKKRGISTTIYLGVNKENKNMVAHAWIRCGQMFVTGGDGSGYATVAKFSN